MKKIAIASAAMGGAALIAFGASGTFAAFSDSETRTVATDAGTLLIGVNNPSSAVVAGLGDELAPGDTAYFPYLVTNDGDGVPGALAGSISAIQSAEGGCYDPERAAGDTCDVKSNPGELAGQLTLSAGFVLDPEEGSCTVAAAQDFSGYYNVNQLLGRTGLVPMGITPAQSPVTLETGDSACVFLAVTVSPNAGNDVQSDTVGFTVNFVLEQQIAQG